MNISMVELHRRFLMSGVAYIGLAPGMVEAHEKARVVEIDQWIAAHPETARQLSKDVEAGKYGDIRAT